MIHRFSVLIVSDKLSDGRRRKVVMKKAYDLSFVIHPGTEFVIVGSTMKTTSITLSLDEMVMDVCCTYEHLRDIEMVDAAVEALNESGWKKWHDSL